MIDLARIVENQANLSSYNATKNEERAVLLEQLIEYTKPVNLYTDWHFLIATPFRYNPPYKNARFRPRFAKRNVFYASSCDETACYEYGYHFMKERQHLSVEPECAVRTLFYVTANDQQAVHLQTYTHYQKIMDKHDYSASHQFIADHAEAHFIIYPSCRDPEHRDNAAILEIGYLDKKPKWETSLKLFYDYQKKQLTWLDKRLSILWDEVK